MWPFKRPQLVPPTVEERLTEVEDELKRLERRFLKVQGEFTSSLRRQAQLERENDDLNDEIETLSAGGE